MKHCFVRPFICLIFITHFQDGTTVKATTPSCPSRPSNDFIGPPGIPGRKGEKGETSKAEIAIVEETVSDLQENMTKMLESTTAALLRGYVELPDGWISPFNGYQHKITSNLQTWNSTRKICQNWGGDLVVYGARDFNTRLVLSRVLLYAETAGVYIGITDENTEGKCCWVNGNRYASTDFPWAFESNDSLDGTGGHSENCALMSSVQTHFNDLRVWDLPCSRIERDLCEKPV